MATHAFRMTQTKTSKENNYCNWHPLEGFQNVFQNRYEQLKEQINNIKRHLQLLIDFGSA